jgi:CBS-domain-containing membrane protein
MLLDWQGVMKKARRRIGLSDIAQAVAAGLGVTLAIGGMEWSSLASQYPLALIPFATSIVLVMGSPEAEPAQPRALIGGHIVATLVGFAVLWLAGPQAWAAAAAVGLAVLAMYITGTFHPPAGINPLLVVAGGLPWSFLLAPVLVGTVSLTAFAYIWHRWLLRRPWPLRWL